MNHLLKHVIGTQIIAKGLHFPHVALVGVLWADAGLSLPDFRAGERTFAQLVQVTGDVGNEAMGHGGILLAHICSIKVEILRSVRSLRGNDSVLQ